VIGWEGELRSTRGPQAGCNGIVEDHQESCLNSLTNLEWDAIVERVQVVSAWLRRVTWAIRMLPAMQAMHIFGGYMSTSTQSDILIVK
jgi:hypothetical protein